MKRQLFTVVSLVFASAGIGGSGAIAATSAQAATADVAAAPPSAPQTAPVRATSAWHGKSAEAFAEARRSGKPVLVDLYANWCGWCKTMEREVFAQPKFQHYAERFVLLRVDVEDGASGSELQRRFMAESLPTLLLLDPKQSLLGRIEGYLETDRLIARLDAELAKYDAFLASYQSALASADPALWLERGRDLHSRGDGGRAAVLFEKLLGQGHLAGEDLYWVRLQLADAYRMDGRFTEARKAVTDLQATLAALGKTTPAAPAAQTQAIAERVDLLLVFIAGGEHDCTGAAGALRAFEQGHPRSLYLSDARRAYAALKSDSTAQCS